MKQFTPMAVIRLSSNENLKALMDLLEIPGELNWENAEKQDIMDFVAAQKADASRKIHSALREIHFFGNHPFAKDTARKQAELSGLTLPADFEKTDLRYDYAIQLRLYNEKVWHDTIRFLKADCTPARSWKFIPDIEIPVVKTDKKSIDRLSRVISAFFFQHLTCGQHFEVSYRLRSPGVHYFFMNFKALAGRYEHWNDDNHLVRKDECHSIPVILTCDENKREIAAYAEGGSEITMPLLRFFAKIILGIALPEANTTVRNNIEQMKYSGFEFVFDFDSGIESVKCREMTVGIIGRPGKYIRIRVPENGPADEIAKSLASDLDGEQLPLDLLIVRNVYVQVKMKNDPRGNGFYLYITPMNDPLRKLPEGKRFICERLLKESRIHDR